MYTLIIHSKLRICFRRSDFLQKKGKKLTERAGEGYLENKDAENS